MPRPEPSWITLTIDGREVHAPEGAMLVDGAKHGDVEIPYFCYEPKLGPPVGACRMCLVEVEGIPKLQTACSTPVKDGMVVHTQTERVRAAQQAVVEFLLINHPLDCPVCDKGGECPLQDISFGWGAGTSRFIEPKRHFRKPLELSPLVAIDRERCILCYRCVRFSQDVAEDYQLVLHERGAHTFVGTFDGHPYVAPFAGNIIELCPVGALTSTAYRFRARPWDIEAAGSVCTLCPAQCNVTFTVRDERVLRVLSRNNPEVDDGWLCDKGRYAYQSIHVDERLTRPLLRDGGTLRPVSWERALDAAAAALRRADRRVGALAGDGTSNEEGFLLGRLLREGLGSPHLDCRGAEAEVPPELARALAAPAITARVSDLEFAHAVLVLDCEAIDDAPILDLRLRKGAKRRGVKLVVATSRPSALDPAAALSLRFAPGAGEALLVALDAALARQGDLEGLAAAASADPAQLRRIAELLSDQQEIVVLWGERLARGRRAPHALRALLNVARRLGVAERAGAGLLEIPLHANGRGLREAGFLPNCGPGYAAVSAAGLSARGIGEAAAAGELSALYLLHADPLRTQPDRELWERALERVGTVIAHASLSSEPILEHADIVFPAESYAEKEGTIVHPDGRVQRLRQSIGRPDDVRATWQVLAELAQRVGYDLDVLTGPMATEQLVRAVPFYRGLTLEEIGGPGVRWTERDPAIALSSAPAAQPPFALQTPPAPSTPNGALRLGTFRSLWAAPEVQAAPALKFLVPHQRVELAPTDAQRLGVGQGDEVEVALDGQGDGGQARTLRGAVHLHAATPPGTAFVVDGLDQGGANELGAHRAGALVAIRRVAVSAVDGAGAPGDGASGTDLTGAAAAGDTPASAGPTGEVVG